LLFLFVFAGFLAGPAAEAAWVADGNAVCAATSSQGNVASVSDGAGGSIIAWSDGRGGNSDIYAQRIDGYGNVMWTLDGVVICTAANNQIQPCLASDGAGGAIVAWGDLRNGNYDIYAQRVNSLGTVQWTANGVAVCTATGEQRLAIIASDGAGGAIITWQDWRSGSNFDIYSQRVNASGGVQWAANGVVICDAANNQLFHSMVADGAGGAIITWSDYRAGLFDNTTDIYAQRVNASGVVQWTANGVTVCAAAEQQSSPDLCTDGSGGAIIAWADGRSGTYFDIYAQRINSSGSAQWTVNGVVVSASPTGESTPRVVSDGAAGAIISYLDYRSSSNDVYAQRVNASGVVQWVANGVALCTAADNQYSLVAASDGTGGAIISWYDHRTGSQDDIYAQRIDASGALLWTANGEAACVIATNQQYPTLASDGASGAIIAWVDSRNGSNLDIYAQRVKAGGRIDAAEIRDLRDLPGDQGGWVRLTIRAAIRDKQGETVWPITGYNVWRRIGNTVSGSLGENFSGQSPAGAFVPGADLAGMSSAGASHGGSSSNGRPPLAGGPELAGALLTSAQASAAGFPAGEWESIGFHAAIQDTEYSFVVPTKNDSTGDGSAQEVFVVSAHTTTPWIYFVSAPDSGHSVDNLSPSAPSGLAGKYGYPASQLLLTWLHNFETDLFHYAVYKGDFEGFIPSESNRIGIPTDTFLVDSSFDPNATNYYKVSAWDVHGNQSSYALLRPSDVTGVIGTPSVPTVTMLDQNVPNPFNPRTVIRFSIANPGPIRLIVYDVTGRPARLLAQGYREPGRYEVTWDGRDDSGRQMASGAYICVLDAPGQSQSRKMILLK